ncbi:MAG: hypothetical protein ACREF9_00565 [Opitutaceae bacterium]
MSNFPAPAVTWGDVARVCRRVCVLRERGHNEEAERLRAGELMTMLAAIRSSGESDTVVTERLNALFATEAERVASAAVLAEMLVPLISDQLRPMVAAAANSAAVSTSLPVSPVAKPAAPRGGSIADFIDEMIAQETPPDRPGHDTQRRAS